jgi:hypothetical protein
MEIDWFNTFLGVYLIWMGINYGTPKEDDDV